MVLPIEEQEVHHKQEAHDGAFSDRQLTTMTVITQAEFEISCHCTANSKWQHCEVLSVQW